MNGNVFVIDLFLKGLKFFLINVICLFVIVIFKWFLRICVVFFVLSIGDVIRILNVLLFFFRYVFKVCVWFFLFLFKILLILFWIKCCLL